MGESGGVFCCRSGFEERLVVRERVKSGSEGLSELRSVGWANGPVNGQKGVIRVARRGIDCELYSNNWICLCISHASQRAV